MKDQIRVVQASMIGSIFSNLLFVLGCCFAFGGVKYKEQKFSSMNVTTGMGLLALSSIGMVLPTPFAEYYEIEDPDVLIISRTSASFLLFSYMLMLYFQLFTHREVLEGLGSDEENQNDGEEEEEATIPMLMALTGLGATTLLVSKLSDYLVDSIDGLCEESGISHTFVGLIILPIVGNAVEHITAVSVAMKNKMELAIGVAVGSCTQIALFVVPVVVIFGWCVDKPMTLNYPGFEIQLYILSIFTVSVCLNTGKSNWLLGSVLVITYFMIAIGFWFERIVDF
jgi:Ca2+:H+ antiporter